MWKEAVMALFEVLSRYLPEKTKENHEKPASSWWFSRPKLEAGSSQTQSRSDNCVRSEVFTAVTMKNPVFWDVAPCRFCVNRRFGGT
jgi:hypothetical protein